MIAKIYGFDYAVNYIKLNPNVKKTKHNNSRVVALLVCLMLIFGGFVCINLPIIELVDLPSSVVMSYGDLQNLNWKNIKVEHNFDNNLLCDTNDKTYYGTINLKAWGLFPIKTIKAQVVPNRVVFGGGYPIGMVINSDGVVVMDSGTVSFQGIDLPCATQLKKGDIIKKINDKSILKIQDISNAINEYCKNSCKSDINGGLQQRNKSVDLSVKRGEEIVVVKATPLWDDVANEFKLGIWVKDRIAGLGTVSYVETNGKYGALGHAIIDDSVGIFPCLKGSIYSAKIIGCEKGQVNKPGALKGVFNASEKGVGNIQKNNKYGVFGFIDKCDTNPKIYSVASRLTVKPGKASILTTVDDKIQEYSIEITKATKQKSKNDKGLVVKIVDKELIKKTGGIVQGMSGSPIIQNGKMVGAMTHVFVNDPMRGYGMYLDWMMEE